VHYDLVFSLGDCSNLKYYIPLVHYAKKRGLKVSFDINFGWKKWCSISIEQNFNWTVNLMNKNNIPKFDRDNDTSKIRVCNEGRWNPVIKEKNTLIYSLTTLTDYSYTYFKYIDDVDFCVFPSEYFINFIKDENKVILGTGGQHTKQVVAKTVQAISKNENKNLFLGSPKYDLVNQFDKKCILEKYGLEDKKYALFVYPRVNDLKNTKFKEKLIEYKDKGFTIITKTRVKDPFQQIKTDVISHYFYDRGFWPSTMLELIYISDVVINTDSCTVKEAIMMDTEVVNIKSKKYNVLDDLYDKDAKKLYLWDYNSCERILDHMVGHF